MMTFVILEPKRLTSQIARIKPGNARIRSITRMMTLSGKPPKKPAIKPNGALIAIANAIDMKPTCKDTRPAIQNTAHDCRDLVCPCQKDAVVTDPDCVRAYLFGSGHKASPAAQAGSPARSESSKPPPPAPRDCGRNFMITRAYKPAGRSLPRSLVVRTIVNPRIDKGVDDINDEIDENK